MRTAIGVDLGGSHVTASVVTEDGAIRHQHEEDLDDLRFESVIAALETTIGAALGDAGNVAGIGIGSPGNIDAASGAVLYSPNFGWKDVPLGETLRAKFPVPVYVANDARCATLGEHTFGAGKLTKDFVLLTLGTGIGEASSHAASCCWAIAGARARSATTKSDPPTASCARAARSAALKRRLPGRD